MKGLNDGKPIQIMWFLHNPPKKIICFFCNTEVDKSSGFVLEYKAIDGTGKVNTCPMCAGMLNDMIATVRETYETD